MKLGGKNMDIVKLEHESYQAVHAAPSRPEYSQIKHEYEPVPFTVAVKTEVEVSCNGMFKLARGRESDIEFSVCIPKSLTIGQR
jgi:hypothetical protein